MTLIVAHHKTRQEAIETIDRGANDLFIGAVGGAVQIIDFRKNWEGPTMSFSFTGSLGFLSIPLAGTVAVDDRNVTVECELPPIVKNFIGDGKIRGSLEEKMKGILEA